MIVYNVLGDVSDLGVFASGNSQDQVAPSANPLLTFDSDSDILAMCCKVISSLVIFAVLFLRVCCCRP